MAYLSPERSLKSPTSKIIQMQEVTFSECEDRSRGRKEIVAFFHYRVLCEDGSVWIKSFNETDKMAIWECQIEPFNGQYKTSYEGYDPLETKPPRDQQ